MKSRFRNHVFVLFLFILVVQIVSCSGKSGESGSMGLPDINITEENSEIRLFSVVSPANNDIFRIKEKIDIEITVDRQTPDSIVVSYDGERVTGLFSPPWNFSIPPEMVAKTGRKTLKIVGYKNGRSRTSISKVVLVYSDIVPEKYSYIINSVYPHDEHAFTQGLFYEGGELFEGTGQVGSSSLRQVDLESGNVNRQLNLDPDLFGEGITLFDNMIFQVTWTSNVGFIYDRETFRQQKKFYYQSDAWGLTTVDDNIVMSDGTNVLWFYDPDMFTVVSKIEVYDNIGQVTQLNELEYINGEIWANIWLTNRIARIDPVSGKVKGYVDLSGILDDPSINTNEDVLNGIAFDKDNGRIFVTGKYWPNLFEISVVPE